MFAATSPPPSTSSWRHHVQDQEEDLVREIMQANDVDAVLARMENDHFRHLTPIIRKLSSYDAAVSATPTSPRAGAPPTPPPPPEPSVPRTYGGGFRGSVGWDAQPSPSILQSSHSYVPRSYRAASPVPTSLHIGMDDNDAPARIFPAVRQPPPPPPMQASPSPVYGTVAHDSLDAYRRPAGGAATAAPHLEDCEAESRYQRTIDSWMWPGAGLRTSLSAASQQLHVDPALDPAAAVSSRLPPPTPSSSWSPTEDRYQGNAGARSSRVTTRVTSAAPPRPFVSLLGEAADDPGGLENAAQSRIARQLQLLRNYRQLAELCSSTDSPSTDLFRTLPSEELARMQMEQIKGLAQRAQSPITVNNNYYFDSASGDKHDNSRRSRGVDGGQSLSGSDNPLGAVRGKPNTGMAPGSHRSASDTLTADNSLLGVARYRPCGASSSQQQRPPLLPSPRAVPLQSPHPSSEPDSPIVTPPLSLRGGNLAPPSPSRSQRGRSHCSRLFDAHYTPTATTEEAGSSYGEGSAEDEDGDDHPGDCMDNGGSENNEEYDDNGTGYRRPPPRIIEREQHRRFPNASIGDDALPSSAAGGTAQSLLVPYTLQPEHKHQNSYSGHYANSQSLATINEHLYDTGNCVPPGMHSCSTAFTPSDRRNNVSGAPGSDGGRCSVSSAINVLSGDQELRANAQRQSAGVRSSHDDRRASQQLAGSSQHSHQQQRRSLSMNSSPVALHGSGALTDPCVSPNRLSLHNLRRGSRERDGGLQPSPTPVSRNGGNAEHRVRTTPTPEKRPTVRSGTNGVTAPGSRGDRRRKERSGPDVTPSSHRKDETRRGGGRRGNDSDDDRYVNSVRSGTYDSDSDDSTCNTPGNPQLQTHKPPPSAQRQRQTRRRHREPRPSLGGGERGSRRRGYDDCDGKTRFGHKHFSAKARAYPTQRGRRGGGENNGGVDNVWPAASHSCSYTTDSDISDYVPRSYYSPTRTGHLGGGRRGARGGMNSPGRSARAFPQQRQPYVSSARSSAAQGHDGRGGRGSAAQALYSGRGRGGAMLGSYHSGVSSAAALGVGYGGHQSLGSPRRYRAVARGGVSGGNCSPYYGGGELSLKLGAHQQHRQQGCLHRVMDAGARDPRMPMVGGSAGQGSGMVRLPGGRVTAVASPEARQYQPAMRRTAAGVPVAHVVAPIKMQQQQQQMGYTPSAGAHPLGPPYAARLSGRPSSTAPLSIKSGRAASPSVAPSVAMAACSNYGAGGSGPHVQPGLLYGSLLPKARLKTALVVEEDEHGRSRSVDPHGDANHTPLLERGSICPLQSVRSSSIQPWRLGSDVTSGADIFPIAGVAINGSTNTGVLPLAWKSSGSGCVVGRTGHIPVAPRGNLSSHYVPPGSINGRKQPQYLPRQQPQMATVVGASSPAPLPSHLLNNAARPTAASASVTGIPSPQKPPPPQQQQPGYYRLHSTDAGPRDSLLSLHISRPQYNEPPRPAEIHNKVMQPRPSRFSGGNAQQRYAPLQGPLEKMMPGRRETALQQQLGTYSSSNRALATRNANAQRFGITALQG
ncbi:hypothetical protein LPMP_240960 [Leishmania panamensis]|uniref:Uncharacterized protein n=1 Tax=Leishmania panamensis TaxID=5679 RepID=A0A088RU18_LEIPA|nr:hypothetical protein LPMP_240960 [Leishmania panamensis]AIN98729.1 hypothetical protein LPMP_240960 [Leishmania panamensis]